MMQGKHARSRRMREVLVLQKNTPSQDDSGQPIESWSNVITLHAQVVPKTAREFSRNANMDAQITHVIRCRYYDGEQLTPLHRLQNQDGSRTYNVVGSFDPDMTRRMLEVHAKEQTV